MEATYGECRFCGSSLIIESPEKLTEDEANLTAMQRCSCSGAIRYRALERAHETVDKVCDEENSQFEVLEPDVIALMKQLCELIYDGKLYKLQFGSGDEIIKMGEKEGDIWVSRKRVLEIES